jgi:hypothetical protein
MFVESSWLRAGRGRLGCFISIFYLNGVSPKLRIPVLIGGSIANTVTALSTVAEYRYCNGILDAVDPE